LPQWDTWDKNRETLVVDASETELQVRMERIDTTGDSWLADMQQKLEPDVYSVISELAPNYRLAEPLGADQ
jgi:hypothetical protein